MERDRAQFAARVRAATGLRKAETAAAAFDGRHAERRLVNEVDRQALGAERQRDAGCIVRAFERRGQHRSRRRANCDAAGSRCADIRGIHLARSAGRQLRAGDRIVIDIECVDSLDDRHDAAGIAGGVFGAFGAARVDVGDPVIVGRAALRRHAEGVADRCEFLPEVVFDQSLTGEIYTFVKS